MGCSFEAKPPPVSPSGGAKGGASPDQSRWEECFRCLFECGIYEGPAKALYEPADIHNHCKPSGTVSGHVIRGLYVQQLQMWLRLFPAEQLLVLNHEEVRRSGLVSESICSYTHHTVWASYPCSAAPCVGFRC